ETYLDTRLVESHVVQEMIESDDLLGRMAAVARLGAQAVHPTDEPLVELRVHAHGIEHTGPVLHEAGQDLIDIGDGKGIIGAIGSARSCGAGAPSIPGHAHAVSITHEENVFGMVPSRDQDRYRLRLIEAGQIIKVAVLPIRIFDIVVAVPHRCRGQYGDRVAAHQLEERAAATRELVAQVLSARARGPRDMGRRGAPGDGFMANQCSGAPGEDGAALMGSSSSNTTCTLTRTNSTSSA